MKRLILVALVVLTSCAPAPRDAKTGADPGAAGAGAKGVQPSTVRAIAPTLAASERPKLAVDSEGLRWFLPPNGSARPLAFGMPEAEVLASLERVRGPAAKGVNQDCGAGPVQYATWSDGLSLVFQNGRFAGWGLDRRASGVLATANGVGPGATRSLLEGSFGSVTFQHTSLGSEFAAGDIFGLLDGAGPEARITDMWAGVSCVAR
jgi:hypothetical protein